MKDIITHKSREVKHCPPHFTKVPIEISTEWSDIIFPDYNNESLQTRIRNWLHENCEHRFFIGSHKNHSNQTTQRFVVDSVIVSFENPADATYFTLLLPSFSKKQ